MNHKYRKKPVIIEAYQFTQDASQFTARWPEWLLEAWHKDPELEGSVFVQRDGRLVITTLEGKHIVSWDDYIIQGVKGEIYACKPDIFKATYEEVLNIPSEEYDIGVDLAEEEEVDIGDINPENRVVL